jgi:type I restriction enzyme, S subunit
MTPEGWKHTPVRDVLDRITAGVSVNSESRPRRPGELGVLKTSAVTYGVFRPEENKVVVSEELHRVRENPAAGCVLLSRMNTPALVGASAYVDRDWPDLVLPDRLWQLRPRRDLLDARWFFHLLASPDSRTRLTELASGTSGSMKNLSQEKFFTLSLPLPPLGEQRKIAAILSSVDDAIEATKAVIDQLQVVKKAMMAELLTRGLPGRHTRFKMTEIGEVPEAWELATLGELCRKVTDGPHFSPKYVSRQEGIPFLSARNLTEDAWSLDDAKYVSKADHEEFCKRARPELNDVLYTKGGTTGVARVNDLAFEFSVWVHIALLKIKPEAVDSYFLAAALNSERCYRQARLMTHGTSNQDLGLTRMVKIRVPLPPLSEQREIAAARRDIASRLEIEGAWKRALCHLKSALMSVLLTGEVRVKPDEEAA